MIHTKNKDVVTRLDAFCLAFGWQSGTIHQVAQETGCDTTELVRGEAHEWDASFSAGWFAYRTNSLDFNLKHIKPIVQGNLQFWLGVSGGVQTTLKLKETPTKKF